MPLARPRRAAGDSRVALGRGLEDAEDRLVPLVDVCVAGDPCPDRAASPRRRASPARGPRSTRSAGGRSDPPGCGTRPPCPRSTGRTTPASSPASCVIRATLQSVVALLAEHAHARLRRCAAAFVALGHRLGDCRRTARGAPPRPTHRRGSGRRWSCWRAQLRDRLSEEPSVTLEQVGARPLLLGAHLVLDGGHDGRRLLPVRDAQSSSAIG